jgi:hypothetical protein
MTNHSPRFRRGLGQEDEAELLGRPDKYPALAAAAIPARKIMVRP